MAICIGLNCVLLVDLLLHIVYYGPWTILQYKKSYVWEGTLQVAFYVCLIVYYACDVDRLDRQIRVVEFLGILLLLRFPIISSLLMELYDFNVIVTTAKKMFSPFLSVLFSLYLILFMFNAVGIVLFSGVVKLTDITAIESTSPTGLYYLLNFNDAYTGMMTLFAAMISINGAITDIYCELLGSNWPRLFFGTFYVVTFQVVLNIVISFILEVYSVSHVDTQKQLGKIKNAAIVANAVPTKEQLEELIKKAAILDQIKR